MNSCYSSSYDFHDSCYSLLTPKAWRSSKWTSLPPMVHPTIPSRRPQNSCPPISVPRKLPHPFLLSPASTNMHRSKRWQQVTTQHPRLTKPPPGMLEIVDSYSIPVPQRVWFLRENTRKDFKVVLPRKRSDSALKGKQQKTADVWIKIISYIE